MQLATRLSTKERYVGLLEAWRVAPDDTDIEVRIGRTGDGDPAVMISVGDSQHAFTTDEASIAADAMESTIKQFGQLAVEEGLDNLVLALRQGIAAAIRKGSD